MGRERHRVSDIDNEYSDENTSTTSKRVVQASGSTVLQNRYVATSRLRFVLVLFEPLIARRQLHRTVAIAKRLGLNRWLANINTNTIIQARRASEWFNRPAKPLCCNLSLALRARIVSTTLATAVPRTSLRNRLCWLHDKSGVEMISIDTSTLRDAEVSTRICPF